MQKKIVVFTTGGTIAGANAAHSGAPETIDDRIGSHTPPPKSGHELLAEYPELGEIADIEVVELARVDSMYIGSALWKGFARAAYASLMRDDVDGIMMLTGTNTMQYIAFTQALMIQSLNKPFVITGSMDPNDKNHIRRHLVDSAHFAANSGVHEVVVCFSGDPTSTFTNIYRGANVIEINPHVYNAFGCQLEEPLAAVREGRIIHARGYVPPQHTQPPQLIDTATERIYRLRYAPGSCGIPSPRWFSNKRAEGIVIDAGVQVAANDQLYPLIRDILQDGIAVAVTNTDTRYMTEDVQRKDAELKEHGMIELPRMHSSKAHVKLSWALPQAHGDMKRLQEIMSHNYVGELNHVMYQ